MSLTVFAGSVFAIRPWARFLCAVGMACTQHA